MRRTDRATTSLARALAATVLLLLAGCGSAGHGTATHHLPPTATGSAPPSAAANPWLGRRVVAVTHNGGEDEFPQDTLYALHRAAALGMQVLDVDVQLSKDNQPVLLHGDLDATTNGTGSVADHTAAQLAALDAAYWWVPGCGDCHGRPVGDYPDRGVRTGSTPLPAGASDRAEFGVPTLAEVFTTFPNTYLDIELKPGSDAAPEVAALIARFHRQSRTIVASFDDQEIAQFRSLAPGVATSPGQQASQAFFLGQPLPTGFQILQLPYRYDLAGHEVTVVTPALVRRAHAAGVALWVWDEGATPGTALYARLVGLGVDGVLASKPSALLTVLHGDHEEWSEAS